MQPYLRQLERGVFYGGIDAACLKHFDIVEMVAEREDFLVAEAEVVREGTDANVFIDIREKEIQPYNARDKGHEKRIDGYHKIPFSTLK